MPKYITEEGLEKLKEELFHLKKVKRPEIAQKLKETASFGDLSENSEYAEAKESQAFIEGRILELENIMKEVLIIDNLDRKSDIGVGSTIRVVSSRSKEIFTIVGATEASPGENKISFDSPLGRAFLGKKKGDIILVSLPTGEEIEYKVEDIK